MGPVMGAGSRLVCPGRQRRVRPNLADLPFHIPPLSPRTRDTLPEISVPFSTRVRASPVSCAGTRSRTHSTGNETKSVMCGPIGTWRSLGRRNADRSPAPATIRVRPPSDFCARAAQSAHRSALARHAAPPCSASRSRSFWASAASSTPPWWPLRPARSHS